MQSDRPLKKRATSHAAWPRIKGPGFYHDGRFKDLTAVVRHYKSTFRLNLTDQEMADLVEFLKSL